MKNLFILGSFAFCLLTGCAAHVKQVESDPAQQLQLLMSNSGVDYLWQLDCRKGINCEKLLYQLELLIAERPEATQPQLVLMSVYLQLGRTIDFFVVANNLLNKHPRAHKQAWELSALAAYKIGDLKRTKMYVASGRQYFPDSAWLPFILAGAFFQEGDYPKAKHEMIQAQARGLPRGVELFARGLLAEANQQIAAACDLFIRALSTDYNNPVFKAKSIAINSDGGCERMVD